jgi:hypothetical protein
MTLLGTTLKAMDHLIQKLRIKVQAVGFYDGESIWVSSMKKNLFWSLLMKNLIWGGGRESNIRIRIIVGCK